MLRGISTNRNLAGISDCLQDEKIAFACRYYSATTTQLHKRLVPAEAAALLANGIKIVATYEDGPTEARYFSAERGHQDGTRAHEFAAAIGQPQGTAIYFAVDYDALPQHVRA